MDATAILEKLNNLGVVVTVAGDRLRLEPGSRVPTDLVEDLHRYKSEIITFLTRPRVLQSPKEWHAQEIARHVEQEGICIFWSDLFGEMIVFLKDDSFRGAVPADLVAYTSQELLELFGEGKVTPSPETLRLIHESRRHGAHVIKHGKPRRTNE